MTALAPTSPLVAVAWINAIPGLDAPAATSRPSDPTSWQTTGFVVVSVVGSAGDRDLSASRKPIVQVDGWAYSGGSKPPRGMAGALLERIREATEDPAMSGLVVTPQSASVAYAPALVTDVWLESGEAREIPDPDAGYAHFTIDIGLSWVRAE